MLNPFKKKPKTPPQSPDQSGQTPQVIMATDPKKVLLVIMDGLGLSGEIEGNAFAKAKTPNFDLLLSQFPTTTIEASGYSVGLPWGEVGNSEVGHLTIGSGQIINQNLPRINQAIKDGSIKENKNLFDAIQNTKQHKSDFHFMGLYGSEGVVHSDPKHLQALLEIIKERGVNKNVYLHLFTDGRDSAPTDGAESLEKLQAYLNKIGLGKIATIHGRKYAMDRNKNYKLTEETYNALTYRANNTTSNPIEFLRQNYQNDVTDEFIPPTQVVDKNNKPIGLIKPNDTVFFFNFRSDRAMQLTEAFVLDTFEGFQREIIPLHFVTMIQYDPEYPVKILFEPQQIFDCLSKIVSDNGFKVLKVAETEKYAHVTYFFNGGVEEAFPNEERILIPSRNESFDKIPEMQAVDITQKLMDAMKSQQYHLIVTNYANPDMVGHTGNLNSAIRSLEIIDQALGPLIATAIDNGYNVILSADHGNCDEMIDLYKGEPTTTHTDNPVFFIDVDPMKRLGDFVLNKDEIIYTLARKQPDNFLIDIAPLALNYMNLKPATDMSGVVSATVSSNLSRNI